MDRRRLAACAAISAAVAWGSAQAQDAVFQQPASPPAGAEYSYGRNVITVTASGRAHEPPTATCVVWVNAEGFGVGPEQLDGRRGLSLTINPQPLPNEADATMHIAQAVAGAKTDYPKAPAWLMRVVEASGPAIETACAADHLDPFVVRKITKADTLK